MSEKYDVIIIGAGIGGLVCGCYLAKAGLKVLMIEKNSNPGGCCTSYKIRNFQFDSFVHSLGNLSEGAHLYELSKELNIWNDLKIKRFDPNDIIYTPDFKINFWNDYHKTIEEISSFFKEERKQIYNFSNMVMKSKDLEIVKLTRNKTFDELLRTYFKNEKLVKILSLPVFGNLGVPAKLLNAFTAVKHYKQFIFDGGYYPENGIQVLPNLLLEKFIGFGGKVLLSKCVSKINLKENEVVGVTLKTGENYFSKYLVSASDAKSTFSELININEIDQVFADKLFSMKNSLSLFVIYLGYSKIKNNIIDDGCTSWVMPSYQYDANHQENIDYSSNEINWYLLKPDFSKNNCMVLTHAPFKNVDYWKNNKKIFLNKLLDKVKLKFNSILDGCDYINCSDPQTIYKWTGNNMGAGYGWALTNDQFMDPYFYPNTIFTNLFLCGHWNTVTQGVEGVAISGQRVAAKLLKKLQKTTIHFN